MRRRRVLEGPKLFESGGNSSREKDGAISCSTNRCDEVIHTQYDRPRSMKSDENNNGEHAKNK
jgi:hypothetical protein